MRKVLGVSLFFFLAACQSMKAPLPHLHDHTLDYRKAENSAGLRLPAGVSGQGIASQYPIPNTVKRKKAVSLLPPGMPKSVKVHHHTRGARWVRGSYTGPAMKSHLERGKGAIVSLRVMASYSEVWQALKEALPAAGFRVGLTEASKKTYTVFDMQGRRHITRRTPILVVHVAPQTKETLITFSARDGLSTQSAEEHLLLLRKVLAHQTIKSHSSWVERVFS